MTDKSPLTLTINGRDHAIAVRGGVTGAPVMIFGQQFSVMGAESPEKLVRAIDTATAQRQH